ncbi:MAG: rnhD [Verrucomicrobiales bacterium]|nr:rnhD [Verrucomicrobiales bacterium]
MRVLALDHGTKRIGLAISDEMGMIAQPLTFLNAEPIVALLESLKKVVAERNVEQILVGIPRNMDGTYGPAAEKARKFVEQLKVAIGVPIRTWDERLTSVQANRDMIQGGLRREERKLKADQTAAAILLQSYLDSL